MPPSTSTAVAPTLTRRALGAAPRCAAQTLEYEAVAERLAGEAEQPVLDWGCGAGEMTALLNQRGVAVESFDYRAGEPLRELTLEAGGGASAFVSGDPVALPFADGRFGSVLALGVLEHVQFPDRSLVELRRVLRPGGRLYIYKLPNRRSYLEALARRRGRYYHGSDAFDRVYDARAAQERVACAGFRVERCVRTNMLPLEGPLASRHARSMWRAGRTLARVPLLNVLAGDIEIDATSL
jgi:SAM-dependent methyltransferase